MKQQLTIRRKKPIKHHDDLARASYSQHVHRMSIMAAISVALKLSLDNVNEPSQHCRSSYYYSHFIRTSVQNKAKSQITHYNLVINL